MCVCVCVCVCARARACVRACVRGVLYVCACSFLRLYFSLSNLRVLVSVPPSLKAAAIAVPDAKWGERPVIVAVRKPGATVT